MRRLLLLLALLLAPIPAAAATCPYTPAAGPWYWSVQDSSPGTQVWAGNGGAFVVLADSTYVAWVAAGCTPTTIDTAVNLHSAINLLARTAWAGSGTGLTIASLSANTLTNPLTSVVLINYAGGSATVTMPKQDLPNSIPIGQPVTFVWGGSVAGSLTINMADGSSLIAKVLSVGDIVTITPSDNTSTNGGWRIVSYNVLNMTPGTGTAGQVRVGQGTGNAEQWQSVSGDCALAASGAITCTKTNGTSLGPYATAAQGQIPGTTTNDTATAGNVGEVMEVETHQQTATVTFTNGSPVIAWTTHGLSPGAVVSFTSTGSLPSGFVVGTDYYVISTGLTTNAIEVSATAFGTAITAGSAGSGTQTGNAVAVQATTSTPQDYAAVQLTAGNWECGGSVGAVTNGATTNLIGFLTLTSNTITGVSKSNWTELAQSLASGGTMIGALIPRTFQLSGTTTVYADVDNVFSAGASNGFGKIHCVRTR